MSLTLSSLALWTMAFLHTRCYHAYHLPGLRGHGCCDLAGVHSVVHQQQFDVLLVAEEELSESICQRVTGLSSRAIANGGEGLVASELTTDSAINTVGGSPRFLNVRTQLRDDQYLHRLCCTCQKRSGWGDSSAS